ncbi:double-stranded rna-binding [Pyrenophora seminiperda CCB06]|uniref:Double-stranded rna-binding n=1 Tax=Pyrenophora seminiperda CCB06 TaxID=1302712 RepID=A0A3M7MHB7_9PLEO|nr:double-stranded rna-binding [Pyrenophora seminiperda CCB06]
MNVQIETPTAPPTSNMFAATDNAGKIGGLVTAEDQVFTIDDFLNKHKDAYVVGQVSTTKNNTTTTTTNTMSKTPITPLTPIAVGARSSKYTILLHEKYQALGIPQPLFTFAGGSSEGWSAKVSFPGLQDAEELQGIGGEKKYNSKQEVKEAVSETAVAVLEELESKGRVKGERKKKKSGGSGGNGAVELVDGEEKEVGENWVGQLLEFQRSISAPQPTYTDYASGTRFACLLTLDNHPAGPFGSLDTLFSSKKAARQAAARAAIASFKTAGNWPDAATPLGGIKKKKKQQEQPQTPQRSSSSPISTPPTPTSGGAGAATATYASRVAHLATTLALATPEYHFSPNPQDPTFHTVSCHFRDGGPHAGPLGEVRNVYGKKRAKEECARLTFVYLEGERERRVALGKRLLEGVRGVKRLLVWRVCRWGGGGGWRGGGVGGCC